MKPNTRLLIRFTLPNGDQKGWGYDYPYYQKLDSLRESIKADFKDDIPENTEIRLFYYNHDDTITATTAEELANKVIDWLIATGEYNGN